MNTFTKVFLVCLLAVAGYGSGPDQVVSPFAAVFSLSTPLSFTQNTADFSRPGAGANEWSYDQNDINIPIQGTNTQRLDRYWRFTWLDFQNAKSTVNTII